MEIWLLGAVAVVALLLYWQRNSAEKKAGNLHTARSNGGGLFVSANSDQYVRPPYRAVSIECGENACRAARAKGNLRYLVDSAPMLPLEACDAGRCTCKYVHHLDRRSSSLNRRRSRSVTMEESLLMGTGERRESPQAGRRATDRRRSGSG